MLTRRLGFNVVVFLFLFSLFTYEIKFKKVVVQGKG